VLVLGDTKDKTLVPEGVQMLLSAVDKTEAEEDFRLVCDGVPYSEGKISCDTCRCGFPIIELVDAWLIYVFPATEVWSAGFTVGSAGNFAGRSTGISTTSRGLRD
jgi:hypothetical protein